MSEDRWDRLFAASVAIKHEATLYPFCMDTPDEIAQAGWKSPKLFCIAGSIRRERPDVGDIEILYVPKVGEPKLKADMFDLSQVDLCDVVINEMLARGEITKRLNSKYRVSSWGPKNKYAVDKRTLMPIDFFATTVESWWVSLVIRTGGKQTNLDLTNGALALGRTLHAYGSGISVLKPQRINERWHEAGEKICCNSEQEVFVYCNVPYAQPHMRR